MAPPHLYLAHLDIRILKAVYGDFSQFPSTLLPRVEHVSSVTIDEALRKRVRYVDHLPLGCVVSFLECDWSDLVSEEILKSFATELQRRRKTHHEKAAQEEREREQSERLEAAANGHGVQHLANMLREDNRINADDFVPLAPTIDYRRAGFERLAELSTSPSESRTVWGTRAVTGGDWTNSDSNIVGPPVDDGWLDTNELMDAQIAAQIEALELTGNEEAGGVKAAGGKKKKKPKLMLMSTSSRRAG